MSDGIKTVITVATGSQYWGKDCGAEDAIVYAKRLAARVNEEWPGVSVKLVPERESSGNKSTGDFELVETIEAFLAESWLEVTLDEISDEERGVMGMGLSHGW